MISPVVGGSGCADPLWASGSRQYSRNIQNSGGRNNDF